MVPLAITWTSSAVCSSVIVVALTFELLDMLVRILLTVCTLDLKLVNRLILVVFTAMLSSDTVWPRLTNANFIRFWALLIIDIWSSVNWIWAVLKLIIFSVNSKKIWLLLILLALKPEKCKIKKYNHNYAKYICNIFREYIGWTSLKLINNKMFGLLWILIEKWKMICINPSPTCQGRLQDLNI